MLINRWRKWLAQRDEQRLLRDYGAISWCPQCRNVLQGISLVEEIDWQGALCRYRFTCQCGCVSHWVYGEPVIYRVAGPGDTLPVETRHA